MKGKREKPERCMKGSDTGKKRQKLEKKPSERGSGRNTLRKVKMVVWTAGEPSRPMQREMKRRKTGPP